MLLRVNGELKDVAKGKIVTPLNRVFHGRPMADDVFRVTISRALPGCGGLDPPSQPAEADSELNLEQCVIWPMIWPKELIRVNPSVTTPVQHTQDEEEDNDGDDDPNDFLADDPYDDGAHNDRYNAYGSRARR